ncbi:MAG: hypothetical protein WD379_04930 [Dehalococcoidia bacterium]
MTFPRRLVLLLVPVAALALALAACKSGGDSGDGGNGGAFPTSVPLGEGDIFAVINNSSLAVGDNRLSLAFFDAEDRVIEDAAVHLAFFDLNGEEPVQKSEADARYVPVELFYIDEASGQEKRVVGSGGVYVSNVSFDAAGDWGFEAVVTTDGEAAEPITFQFTVLEDSPEPSVGEPAPPSEQLTLADVDDISEIDSSFPPRPHMHEITVADALALGKPMVVAIGTPAFCETRVCGPVMEMAVDPNYEKFKDDVTFIHIEPYQLAELRAGEARIPVAATEDWGITSEPWTFVVDSDGLVAAKFEGVTAADEIEAALADLLAGA